MKILFSYSNGDSQLHLIPENQREKAQINLFREDSSYIKIGTPPQNPEGITFYTSVHGIEKKEEKPLIDQDYKPLKTLGKKDG